MGTRGLIALACLGLAGCGGTPRAGGEPLFPAGALAGWRVSDWSDLALPQKVAGEAWRVEGGVVEGLGKRTWLISPDEYGDFVLRFEWKIAPGSNGGVGLRFPPEGDPAYRGMEIQIVDAAYYRGEGHPNQLTGAIYDEVAPSEQVAKPVGEWNTQEIVCRGDRVAVTLNGRKIIDIDMNDHREAHNTKSAPPLADRPRRGHIGFQNLNGSITLRDVTLQRLD